MTAPKRTGVSDAVFEFVIELITTMKLYRREELSGTTGFTWMQSDSTEIMKLLADMVGSTHRELCEDRQWDELDDWAKRVEHWRRRREESQAEAEANPPPYDQDADDT